MYFERVGKNNIIVYQIPSPGDRVSRVFVVKNKASDFNARADP